MVKGNIGAGILALPRAVSLAGLWVGSIGIIFLSLFCVTCMHLIVACSHRLSAKVGRPYMSYANHSRSRSAQPVGELFALEGNKKRRNRSSINFRIHRI